MVTRCLHLFLLCALAVSLVSGLQPGELARAQEPSRPPIEFLLLEGNRVMQGRVTPSRETLSVEQDSAGIVIVPKSQVRFQGPDMHSVYVFLQDGLPKEPTANDHVRLARWCVGYKMLPEARFELETALDLEPGNDIIRRNLATLDTFANRTAEPSKPVKAQSPAQRQAKLMGLGEEEVESLGGLSREAGKQFTNSIQPILMHNCTNSACHGQLAEHALKFQKVRLGSTSLRGASEKNLLALLKYIDRDKPRRSPLWKILITNHGAQGSSIFTGAKGEQQLQKVKEWVLSIGISTDTGEESPVQQTAQVDPKNRPVAAKGGRKPVGKITRPLSNDDSLLENDNEEQESPSPRVTNARTSASGTIRPVAGTVSRRTGRPLTEVTEQSARKTPDEEDSSLPEVDSIVSKVREPMPELPLEDAFDPEVFNRRQRMKRNEDE